MAAAPAYAATPKTAVAAINTANTARDGTGTIGTVFTAGASGSRIDRIVVEAQGSATAGMIRIFLHNGTTSFLFAEIPVAATTPAANTPAFRVSFDLAGGLPLPTGWSVRASTEKAETFNVFVCGGDF